MNVEEVYQSESQWLKADDLKGRSVNVTIRNVTMTEVGGANKMVVWFNGAEKGLVLNKTNAGTIAMMYGQETDSWGGGQIEIYPTMVDFQGKMVPALRVKPVSRNNGPAAQGHAAPLDNNPSAPAQPQQATDNFADDMSDEIPF